MDDLHQSSGDGRAPGSAPQTGITPTASREVVVSRLPVRDGEITVADLINLYMAQYAGRDMTRGTRLAWWKRQIGAVQLKNVSDDEVFQALEFLSEGKSVYFAGKDAAGAPILKSRKNARAPATINRYSAAIGAVFTWAITRRVAPKGWAHPCRAVARRPESNDHTRYLSDDERERLLGACKQSGWPKLYLLILMALTTGARRGELMGLRWTDIDLQHAMAAVGRSKNGDPKMLPLVPKVLEELGKTKKTATGFVFASDADPKRIYSFQARWMEALKAAAIKEFRFHDLRHSCASMLAQNGATLLEIADLLGHRQLQVTKRYSHLAVAHKLNLVTRVLGDVK